MVRILTVKRTSVEVRRKQENSVPHKISAPPVWPPKHLELVQEVQPTHAKNKHH